MYKKMLQEHRSESTRGFHIPMKEDTLDYCLHNLIAFDPTPLKDSKDVEKITRDNVQLLLNKVFELPAEATEDGIFAQLPENSTVKLPRSLPAPKAAPLTRWEKFAKSKGIVKRKRSRMVWDDTIKDWAPRWGYKSKASNAKAANVILELKPGQRLTSDLFEDNSRNRQIQKTKQKLQEVRNAAERNGSALPVGVPNLSKDVHNRKTSKVHLNESMKRAQLSTASFGRHDRPAKGEVSDIPKLKEKPHPKHYKEEKAGYMKVMKKVLPASA